MGFTISEIDKLLNKYAELSYSKYYSEYLSIVTKYSNIYNLDDADNYAIKKVERDFEQGWQGLEMKLNSVGSSRGDYPRYWGII